jgi:hypothetical protein
VEPTVASFVDEVPPGWPNLDFTLYADRFENIQQLASGHGILPLLEDLAVEDLREG